MIEPLDTIIYINIYICMEIIIGGSVSAFILALVKAIISKLKQKQQNPNSKIKELERRMESGEFKFFKSWTVLNQKYS